MNYTEKVKNEILEQIDSNAKKASLLLALTKMCASMQVFKNNQFNLIYEFKEEDVAFKTYELIKEFYDMPLEMGYVNIDPKIFNITIEGKYAVKMLKDMHLAYIDKEGYHLDESNKYLDSISEQEELACYIQGLFLASGSVYFPEGVGSERGYHLEISFNEEAHLTKVVNILKKFGISLSVIDRESSVAVYTKSSETVSDMLALVKAMDAVLKLNDVNVQREMNSKLNRESNIMAANFDKTLAANVKYIDAIRFLDEKIGIDNLDEKMAFVCKARVEHSQLSMSELSSKIGITKSSLNRMLAKIVAKAESLRGGKE